MYYSVQKESRMSLYTGIDDCLSRVVNGVRQDSGSNFAIRAKKELLELLLEVPDEHLPSTPIYGVEDATPW